MWLWWWWSQRKNNENPTHFINTVNTKGYHVISVNDIPVQERPNRCALYYSCARDFEQRIEMPLFALISHFFLGKAFDSRVELLDIY